MKILKKQNLIFFFLLALILLPQLVCAQDESTVMENMKFFGEHLDMGTKDIRLIAADLINQVMSILGLLAFVIVIFAGFRWMISGGKEENVAAAKKTLAAGLVGLLLIVTSYSIANFVLDSLTVATTK